MAPGRKRRKSRHIPDTPEDDAGQESESVIAISPDGGEDNADNEGEEVVPEEEQEQWEAFREEQFEVIEQLPLSLHRMFALLRELDDRYQSYTKELEVAIREYVAYREVLAGSGSQVQALNGDVTDGVGDRGEVSQNPTQALNSALSPDHPNVRLEHPKRDNGPSVESNTSTSAGIIHGGISQSANGKSRTREMLERIAWLSAESVRASEEKLALATTAYNSVDRHVRSLDSVITSEEAALVLGLRPGTRPTIFVLPNANGGASGAGAVTPSNGVKGGSTTRKKHVGRFRRRAPGVKDAQTLQLEQQLSQSQDQGEPPIGDVLQSAANILPVVPNMAVDPNEPRYCHCNQVSYGEMVACDNEECLREWFHYGCVGLTEAPKHHWFCRDCEVLLGKPPRKRKT